MRTYEEYLKILELWECGFNKQQIASLTGIPRPTVRDCINRYQSLDRLVASTTKDIRAVVESWSQEQRQRYAYLLAVYLGDGYISRSRQTYRLRIFMDSRYTNIIQTCVNALNFLFPSNKVSIHKKHDGRCSVVSCYSNHFPSFFPQHGSGRKHNRKISLEAWQQEIVEEYPMEFLRGFIHTDGSRFEPVIYNRVYPRYQFTNHSEDILSLFCNSCQQIGILWTQWGSNIVIARRKDVELLDREIGPKA